MQKGCIMAVGTGSKPTEVAAYAVRSYSVVHHLLRPHPLHVVLLRRALKTVGSARLSCACIGVRGSGFSEGKPRNIQHHAYGRGHGGSRQDVIADEDMAALDRDDFIADTALPMFVEQNELCFRIVSEAKQGEGVNPLCGRAHRSLTY